MYIPCAVFSDCRRPLYAALFLLRFIFLVFLVAICAVDGYILLLLLLLLLNVGTYDLILYVLCIGIYYNTYYRNNNASLEFEPVRRSKCECCNSTVAMAVKWFRHDDNSAVVIAGREDEAAIFWRVHTRLIRSFWKNDCIRIQTRLWIMRGAA